MEKQISPKSFTIALIVIAIIVLFLSSCETRDNREFYQQDKDRLTYFKDVHGICYAYFTYPAAELSTGRVITCVPCDSIKNVLQP